MSHYRAASAASLFFGLILGLWQPVSAAPLPALEQWESNMVTYGRTFGDTLTSGPPADTYQYDAARVYYQIADYTGDQSWTRYAQTAATYWRDGYVLPNEGRVAPWQAYGDGLLQHYQRTGDQQSFQALRLMADNAVYSQVQSYPTEWIASPVRAREVAFNLQLKLAAEQAGLQYPGHADAFANVALGHIDQWFVSQTAPYVQPFIVGLTGEALIRYQARTGDPRVLPALRTAADGLWRNLWRPADRAFLYIDRAVPEEGGQASVHPAPDLNLLIAPMYDWVYRQTGDPFYRQSAEEIFAGGVQNAHLGAHRQFNQNYRWSFDMVQAYQREGGTIANPEPSSWLLASSGLLAVGWLRRQHLRRRATKLPPDVI